MRKYKRQKSKLYNNLSLEEIWIDIAEEHSEGTYRKVRWKKQANDDYAESGAKSEDTEVSRSLKDLKRLEGVLLEEHDMLSSILDSNPVPTLVMDKNFVITHWNNAMEILSGMEKKKVIGKPKDASFLFKGEKKPFLAEIVLKLTDEEIINRYAAKGVKRGTLPESYECICFIWINGKERIVTTQATRIRNKKGEIICVVQCAHDITERYEMERQLRQAQKMEAIGTLAGGIAHDFNNILSAIIGYSEIAISKLQADNPLQRYLNQILKAGLRARDIVKQILDFSRQRERELRPLSITPLIKEGIKLLRASLPSTIKIRHSLKVPDDVILADVGQIQQILMNLGTNAGYAMRETGGTLTVSLSNYDITTYDYYSRHVNLTPGRYLVLTVRDTGCGINKAIIDRIFDPFFSTKKGEGTGMGLSVVHGIVKSFSGDIIVESEEGIGTTFYVYFPLVNKKDEIPKEIRDENQTPTGTESILFVDDEKVIVQVSTEMLKDLGYRVTTCTNSLVALEKFSENPYEYDIVITDYTMPNMTGLELAETLLKIRQDIPIILCTGFSPEISEEKVLSLGLRAILFKPITIQQMAEAIRRELAPRRIEGNSPVPK